MRKTIQAGMLNEIATNLLTTFDDDDGQAAYLAIHILSGRTKLQPVLLAVNPAISKMAQTLFERATVKPPPSEQFELTCVFNCSLEITNEALERHYQDAIVLANHGIQHWPAHAELWRQRGVLRLTEGGYTAALDDLRRAREMKPEMFWINEPIKYAEARL